MKKQAQGNSVPQVPSMQDVAAQIASALGEQSEEARRRIRQIAKEYGPLQSLQFATEAVLRGRDREATQANEGSSYSPSEYFYELMSMRGQRLLGEPQPLAPEEVQVRRVASEIAGVLGERQRGPRIQIERVLRALGEPKVREILQQTQQIEERGGMSRKDGLRRTPGGTFFQVVRENTTPAERRSIFWDEINAVRKQRHRITVAYRALLEAQKPPKQQKQKRLTLPTPAWHERYVWPQLDKRGEATVKLVLTGRPTKVGRNDTYVVIGLQQKSQLPPLPKGLPVPSEAEHSPLQYDVWIAIKHWEQVAPALQEDESDILVIDSSWQTLDQEHGTLVVYATNVTTKRLQEAKKKARSSSTRGWNGSPEERS